MTKKKRKGITYSQTFSLFVDETIENESNVFNTYFCLGESLTDLNSK